jgi:hypothetical protein
MAKNHRTRKLTRCDDGKSYGNLSKRGCVTDPTVLMRSLKVQPATRARFLRSCSLPTGTVSPVSIPRSILALILTNLSAVSFGFYHFACIMLLRYKPGPKFAIRNVGSLSETDVRTPATKKNIYLLIQTASNLIACTRHLRSL